MAKFLRDKLKNKRWVTITLIILGVIAVIVVLIVVKPNNKKPASHNVVKVPANLLPDQQAQYLADQGHYQQSAKVLESQLSTTTSVQDKAQDYYLLTALAVQYKNKSDAQKFASEADQIDPNSNTADSALAIYYQLINNKTQAINYWQLAIKDSNSNAPQYNLLVNQYKTDISTLEASK
jgi:tetratricopeptide (TPR) repeat protein